ncbi:RNA-directed RNA polymerase [ssRNA phage SRR5466725_9]|uniref:RNA-directed RNA polymerase n=1 Tax=ssRNA phage SRR5466725_9 TaxID=2786428 RepID=A0A8S5L428_9VIRU|nr:RNA-directed RNA polymerase [ssRNA phage SRR5466725_9]DAD52425.1 TPA_asm: RNA-directed RNA polymerase [ssRNA phage SRR5466725_9]
MSLRSNRWADGRGKRKSPNTLTHEQRHYANMAVSEIMGTGGNLTRQVLFPEYTIRKRWNNLDAGYYLALQFWSKFSSPGYATYTGKADRTPKQRKEAAIAKWFASNERCAVTNRRLLERECDFGYATSSQILDLARRYTAQTIGLNPPAYMVGEFTGGASTRVKRSPSTIAQKFEGKAHATLSAVPYFAHNFFVRPGWGNLAEPFGGFEVVENSVLFTVPKNSEVDRAACKEPEVNVYLQRAVGLFFRKRLKRSGIDLTNQSNNRQLARMGSTRGEVRYATLDLSSASDTVSSTLVEQILPVKWHALLSDIRVPLVKCGSDTVEMQMFSTMGNGFTFELETLIFWAISRAVATLIRRKGRILVYGDDIVVHEEVARALTRVLPWFGFVVNEKKSFLSGFFRESCGGHYLNGWDITPVFHRKEVTSMTDVIQLANQLASWCLRVPMGVLYDDVILLWMRLVGLVPPKLCGGQSFERSDALVTGEAPRRRLAQRQVRVESPQLGGLIWWLHEKDRGLYEPLSPNEASHQGRWELRPNRSWHEEELMQRMRHEFLPAVQRVLQSQA